MDERVVQFRVGVMVLASFIIAGILVVLFGSLPNVTTPTKTVYIIFHQALGVSRETPIRKSGVLIGRVTEVELNENGVLVTADITAKDKVYTNDICQVSNSLLGGDAVIQIVGSNEKLPRDPIEDGSRLVGIATPDPLQAFGNLEGTLAEAVKSVATTSDEIGRLARRVSDLLENNDEQIARVASKAEETIDSIRAVTENANSVIGDVNTQEKLKQALNDLPDVIHDTREAVNGFKTTLQAADRNLQNMEGLTRPLGQRGPQLVESIDRTAQKLDRVLSEMQIFTEHLNDPNGSLGQLMSDPQLYRRVSSAVANVETLTRQLQPVVRDAREFSNKIARHPELLGVSGALRGSTGAKQGLFGAQGETGQDMVCPPSASAPIWTPMTR
ncbi:MAG TPA: MlaD family protein [Pirellulales bacterium]|jgi:phospholipid/cholesterol/gamma-HCH transport system substrate-binding protein